jgi:hypothetical protein
VEVIEDWKDLIKMASVASFTLIPPQSSVPPSLRFIKVSVNSPASLTSSPFLHALPNLLIASFCRNLLQQRIPITVTIRVREVTHLAT